MEKEGKFILAECKCMRKIRVSAEDYARGVSCPRCGSLVKRAQSDFPEEVVEGEDSSRDNAAALNEEIIRIKEARTSEECPVCKSMAEIQHPNKSLAWCDVCSKMFIRARPDSSAPSPGPPAAPGDESPENPEGGYGLPPVTEKQMQLLRFLSINGEPADSLHASEIVLTTTKILEEALSKIYISFSLFPTEIKFPVLFRITADPIFPKIYFDTEIFDSSSLEPVLSEEINDPELLKALRTYVNTENFDRALDYVLCFGEHAYHAALDIPAAKALALKTFARGFGNKLQMLAKNDKTGKTLVIKRSDKSKIDIVRRIMTSSSAVNSSLDKLFFDNGFKKPPGERESSGCLFAALLLGASGAALFALSHGLLRWLVTAAAHSSGP
jgi:hypothetical protein